ncbi:MAG: hypothetical protein ABIR96_04055 [Bdellovibrionota bacterium]
MKESQKAEKSKIWDIVLLKDNGSWEGFRAPAKALHKTVNYLVVLFLVAAFGSVGWLWSRFELGRSESELATHRLELRSLHAQVASLRKGLGKGETSSSVSEQLSLMPSLDDKAVTSEDIELTSFKVSFDSKGGQLALDFEVAKTSRSALGSDRIYWVLLLHGSHGIQVFPSVLASRNGQALLPLKGQAIENVSKTRKVNARLRAQGFFESAGTDPVYGTLLVYDNNGSLLLRRRASVTTTEIKQEEKHQ